MKSDLNNKAKIKIFVELFYSAMLKDKQLAPFFLDVAVIDREKHFEIVCAYWGKLLFGDQTYARHTMNIHRAVNDKKAFKLEDFLRWLALFTTTVDQNYEGAFANKAKAIAIQIVTNMQKSLLG